MRLELICLNPAELNAFKTAGRLNAYPGLNAEILPAVVAEAALARLEQGEAWQWCAPQLFVESGTVLGAACFKTAPTAGTVDIGYGVAARYEGRGVATAGVRLLVELAFAAPEVASLTAATSPANLASQRVLEKNAFTATGQHLDPEDGLIIGWRRSRAAD